MPAVVRCFLVDIRSGLAERILYGSTGLVLDGSIHLEAVGWVWHGCIRTPRQRNVFRKRFQDIGRRRRVDTGLRVHVFSLVPQEVAPIRWAGLVGCLDVVASMVIVAPWS